MLSIQHYESFNNGRLVLTKAFRESIDQCIARADGKLLNRCDACATDSDDYAEDAIAMDEDERNAMLQKMYDDRRGQYPGLGHVEIPPDPRLNDLAGNMARTQTLADQMNQSFFAAARENARKGSR